MQEQSAAAYRLGRHDCASPHLRRLFASRSSVIQLPAWRKLPQPDRPTPDLPRSRPPSHGGSHALTSMTDFISVCTPCSRCSSFLATAAFPLDKALAAFSWLASACKHAPVDNR
jgi:hypothetical protein